MANETVLDLMIIGGGPIGLACALEAKKANLSYLIIEKGTLINSLYNYPQNMTFFSTSERLEIGGVPFISSNPKPTRIEALEYYRRVAVSASLNIHLFEEVKSISKHENYFEIATSKQSYEVKNIVLATGFYDIPYLLNVPGENLPKVKHYYNDPHFYAFQKVIVVGAANSAVDAALETWRKGAEVTMIVRSDKISDRVKYWVKPDIDNRIAEGSIKSYFNSTIAAIKEHEADIQTPEGVITLPNDWVIALTGYKPNLDFLRSVGVELSDDDVFCPNVNEATQETNVAGIYLAGVICGGMNTHRLFIENSRVHAERIVEDILRKQKG